MCVCVCCTSRVQREELRERYEPIKTRLTHEKEEKKKTRQRELERERERERSPVMQIHSL